VTNDDVERVANGYDTVYAGVQRSPTFARLWRAHAMGADFPEGFEHISFLTLDEIRRMASALELKAGAMLVDLACGMGGPGLWVARETGARLIGLDISDVALAAAEARAERVGLTPVARFALGSFAETGLDDASSDGLMSVDALQYAPDKRAALHEFARVLRPGGRLAIACFEVEPERVRGLPVFGTDPVDDYAPLLDAAGFDVLEYAETAGWRERVTSAYRAILDENATLSAEMGEAAYNALAGEVAVTLQVQPYRRRVLFTAQKR
jgi:ubiquinone/menaquinone biosynthesis C-methylase UbiE